MPAHAERAAREQGRQAVLAVFGLGRELEEAGDRDRRDDARDAICSASALSCPERASSTIDFRITDSVPPRACAEGVDERARGALVGGVAGGGEDRGLEDAGRCAGATADPRS